MTRVLITAQMSLKPYLEAGRLNQQELVASSVSTGGKHTPEMLSGEIACLDLGLHCAYVGGHGWRLTGLPPEGARDATTQSWYSRTDRDEPRGCWGYTGRPPLLSMLSRATWSGGV
jgi:hypothetical protein